MMTRSQTAEIWRYRTEGLAVIRWSQRGRMEQREADIEQKELRVARATGSLSYARRERAGVETHDRRVISELEDRLRIAEDDLAVARQAYADAQRRHLPRLRVMRARQGILTRWITECQMQWDAARDILEVIM